MISSYSSLYKSVEYEIVELICKQFLFTYFRNKHFCQNLEKNAI